MAAKRSYPTPPSLRPGEAAWRSIPTPEARGGGREYQPHAQGAMAAWVQEGREELLHVQGKEVAAALCWSSCEEIPYVQGKRNPSKNVDVARGHQRADTLKP